jgi:hypothetical protein
MCKRNCLDPHMCGDGKKRKHSGCVTCFQAGELCTTYVLCALCVHALHDMLARMKTYGVSTREAYTLVSTECYSRLAKRI